MSAIKEFLTVLFEDLATTEVAIAYEEEHEDSGGKVISYTRMEPGGDAVHFFDRATFSKESPLHDLHRELLLSATGSRKALRDILIAALK